MARHVSSSASTADAGTATQGRFFNNGPTFDIDIHLRKKHWFDITVTQFRTDADRTEGFDIDPSARFASGAAKTLAGFFSDLLGTALGSKNGGDLSRYETSFALGQKEMIFHIGEDVLVYAPNNTRSISVSARDDVFVYAPNNKGSINAKGDDVFVFATDNDGSLSALARSTADASAKAKGVAPLGIDVTALGKAKAEADAYTFVYAKDNKGSIHAGADADAKAVADAQAYAQRGDAKAVAVAEANAEGKILVYAPGDGLVSTSNDADAVAQANALADSRTGDAQALSDALAVASAQTNVIQQYGSYDHYFFA